MSNFYVLAGTNGAGKSSIAGATFRESGGSYFNPDEVARTLLTDNPQLTQADANSLAWQVGVRLLTQAIEKHLDFAIETTLAGNTIPRLLKQAVAEDIRIHVWYVGLSTPELHIERVQSRVRHGGHDIPAHVIRQRFEHSRLNLITLLPHLTALRMFDNSSPGDPLLGHTPKLQLVLHKEKRKIFAPVNFADTPSWAKPIITSAMKLHQE